MATTLRADTNSISSKDRTSTWMDFCLCIALAGLTAIRIKLEAPWTVHHAHDWRAGIAGTCLTTMGISLVAVFTVQGTHDWWTDLTVTDVTTICVFLEPILTESGTHHWGTCWWWWVA